MGVPVLCALSNIKKISVSICIFCHHSLVTKWLKFIDLFCRILTGDNKLCLSVSIKQSKKWLWLSGGIQKLSSTTNAFQKIKKMVTFLSTDSSTCNHKSWKVKSTIEITDLTAWNQIFRSPFSYILLTRLYQIFIYFTRYLGSSISFNNRFCVFS